MLPEPISREYFINPSYQSVSIYIPISFLGNGLVNTFPRQWKILGCIVFFAVYAVSKEIRRSVVPRTSCFRFLFTDAVRQRRWQDAHGGILSLYGSTALIDLDCFFSFLIHSQSVGLLGRGISPSQGRYLHTERHKHRINAHKHINAFSGIQNHDLSVRAGEDGSCLRPRGHYHRLYGGISETKTGGRNQSTWRKSSPM
jgi:hypothetical protein